MEEKNQYAYQRKSGYTAKNFDDAAVSSFADGYKTFLNQGKTERECVNVAVAMAKEKGYVPFEYGSCYRPGDKVYYLNRGKALVLVQVGSHPIDDGLRVCAAHIDSPRIDLKAQPMVEEGGMVYFKTHYYGGIKKFQWLTIPLALHGTVIRADGSSVDISVGEDESEPAFCITDLPPHLSKDQNNKTLSEGVPGESLMPVVASRPEVVDGVALSVKSSLLTLLHDRYGICEEDFLSAELCFVPATRARDIGFDASMIGGYGQDDRVCAYPALRALLDRKEIPAFTSCVILADKEEIGSVGNTGLDGSFFFDMMEDMALALGANPRKMFAMSKCLSSDVSGCFDPRYAEAYDKLNACRINHGASMSKYGGARGKSTSSDASAELVGWYRQLFAEYGVNWQTSELGKVDQGGGGTVAKFLAGHNMDIVDFGVPVLSMHAPFELIGKVDLYHTYLGISALFDSKKK